MATIPVQIFQKVHSQKFVLETVEMSQQLRAPAALAKGGS